MSAGHEAAVSAINYLIGWICILPSEYYEAVKMFDERYDSTHIQRVRGDSNSYDIGRMGNHLVVMNCPAAGTSGQIRAAKIASDMRSTFPAIRFMLLVGIGGGSPSRRDVRLGDVVLGTQVVPYMHGRFTDNGFQYTGRTAYPPDILQSAITRLGAKLRQGRNLQEAIQHIGPDTTHRPEKDILYCRDYIHGNDCDCVKSEPQALVNICTRSRRTGDLVQVHQGVVGSANQVMKNARGHDQHAGSHDILCYEMEAAGIMETTSCLTVGISDYSDGHKNDDWHSYASLPAAVCTKELLGTIKVAILKECPSDAKQDEIVRWVTETIHRVLHSIDQSTEFQSQYQTAERHLNTIVDQYGLVLEMIVPKLYKLVEDNEAESDQQLHDSVASLKDLQGDLKNCLNTLRSRVERQAKRPDNSEATRESWKDLKKGIDERKRWVNDVSKTTNGILGSAPRRFFLTVGRKGNRAMHDSSHAVQHATSQAFAHLKRLLDEYKFGFRANKNDQSKSPPANETPSESNVSRTNVSSPADSLEINTDTEPPQDVSTTPFNSETASDTNPEVPHPDRPPPPPPPSQGTRHGARASEPTVATIHIALPNSPSNNSTNDATQYPPASTRQSPVVPPKPPGLGDGRPFSAGPRHSSEDRARTSTPDYASPPLRHSIQVLPTPVLGIYGAAESPGSSTTSSPRLVLPGETEDTPPSRSVQDLVAHFQDRRDIMGVRHREG